VLPFSAEQFFDVFESYNLAIWPVQLVAYGLGLLAVVLAAGRRPAFGRAVTAVLAAFWLWNGVAYHLLSFSQINGLAVVFGVLFAVQAVLFLWLGVARPTLTFRPRADIRGILGAVFVGYAMVLYPLLGMAQGHIFPRAPVFGVAPCPTTIFTLGLLLWADGRVPRLLLPIPFAWALIATSAALTLGVREDLGLTVAGVLGTALLVFTQRARPALPLDAPRQFADARLT
jgi:hypothetical protein